MPTKAGDVLSIAGLRAGRVLLSPGNARLDGVMSIGFLNTLMLLGLAGAALPVLVHLLSRRKYDVVPWGAMQFLELGRRTRRRIRLEEALLLLLRIGLICLLALALARPWAKGGLFSTFTRSTPRDVAAVIDGSYSMGWEGDAITPQAAAIQRTYELLETLQSSDTVTLLDARDRVRVSGDGPTTDFGAIREQLDSLATPSGTSLLPLAGVKAAQVLAQGEHLDRDIILLTDDQALCWSPQNGAAWRQFDETIRQSSVPPRVWAVDVAGHHRETPANFSVDRLRLSRELTVPGFPLRIQTTIRQWGGTAAQRDVSFAVNGQRLRSKTVTVHLPAGGASNVTFEHRFDQTGSYVVSVLLEPDDLPGDNRSDAAIVVESGIPVLLVDGNRQPDPTKSETFFISAALTPARSEAPWVVARVLEAGKLSAEALAGQRVVFLADVPRLTDAQIELLERFIADGGGLVVAAGDGIDAEWYNRSLDADAASLLPARFDAVKNERDYDLGDVNISSDSLEVSWLARFRTENGVDLTEARFAHWWRMKPRAVMGRAPFGGENAPDEPDRSEAQRFGRAQQAGAGKIDTPSTKIPAPPTADLGEPRIDARLDTGDPFLISQTYGKGTVLQLAVPLDADWSTLPSKNDFVPFVHELAFHLASRTSGRNVEAGMPLVLDAAEDGDENADAAAFEFLTPDGRTLPAEPFGSGPGARVGLRETDLAGVYRCQPSSGEIAAAEYFVVHSDRNESDLTPLSPADRNRLAENDRIRFVSSLEEIVAAMADEESPTDLWRLLMLGVLAMLVGEVLLTRRLVQGGHESLEDAPAAFADVGGEINGT